MKIMWKQGSQHKVDAEVAHKVVESVRKKNGGKVAAEELVKTASAKRNPLHREFEWDDSVAGHQFRLEQARRIVRSLVVVRGEIKTDREQRCYEVVKVPAEVPLDGEKPGRAKYVYQSLDDIMADLDSRAELLGRALSELISIRNRYRDLQELAIIMRAIDDVLEHVPA